MTRRRLAAILLVSMLILSVTWLRSAPEWGDDRQTMSATSLVFQSERDWPDGLQLEGLWLLESRNRHFGNYSALLVMPDGSLTAFSDRNSVLSFHDPSRGKASPRFGPLDADKHVAGVAFDVESATLDARTEQIWLGVESRNSIRRLPTDRFPPGSAQPDPMENWPRNGGAEAMARLADGRFVILGERHAEDLFEAGPGLLFESDPTEGAKEVQFAFDPPAGYLPTDMAPLPDGRVAILLRAMDWAMPPYSGRLILADPAKIAPGKLWPWHTLVDLDGLLPRENYEGLAAAGHPDGSTTLWLISDHNQSTALQRTLLAKLRWHPEGQEMQRGARTEPNAPR